LTLALWAGLSVGFAGTFSPGLADISLPFMCSWPSCPEAAAHNKKLLMIAASLKAFITPPSAIYLVKMPLVRGRRGLMIFGEDANLQGMPARLYAVLKFARGRPESGLARTSKKYRPMLKSVRLMEERGYETRRDENWRRCRSLGKR
jgi:hypothetical protein